MQKTIIELKNVWKTYTMGEVQVHALKGVNVRISTGEFVAILGASGSGKSTMMNTIGCLDIPTKGAVYLYDKDIANLDESGLSQFRGKRIGFIFQQFNLIPTLTAVENVMLPMEFQDVQTDVARKRAEALLDSVGLEQRKHHHPSQLSGGQQQRVAVARALANDPEMILADEPTGNLDSKSGHVVMDMLKRLWKEEGKTIVLVTHDAQVAKHAQEKIELHDGMVVQEG